MSAHIKLITGPMCSGKTRELSKLAHQENETSDNNGSSTLGLLIAPAELNGAAVDHTQYRQESNCSPRGPRTCRNHACDVLYSHVAYTIPLNKLLVQITHTGRDSEYTPGLATFALIRNGTLQEVLDNLPSHVVFNHNTNMVITCIRSELLLDEVQFLHEKDITCLEKPIQERRAHLLVDPLYHGPLPSTVPPAQWSFICSGLMYDYIGDVFEMTRKLEKLAVSHNKLVAVCTGCGAVANQSIRLEASGNPTRNGDRVQLDMQYAPACTTCLRWDPSDPKHPFKHSRGRTD